MPARQDDAIMDLFGFLCGRDMILEASTLLGPDRNNQETVVASDKKEMDTGHSVLHDDASVDTLSKCEQFYLKFQATTGKEVCALFVQFETDGVNMSRLEQLSMQNSKSFTYWKNRKV